MEKHQFKAESQRLLDLMIRSIYTHQEIFLREIISNASDAIDKLAYTALTDDKVGLSRGDFAITLSVDKDARRLTVSDNGIGMDRQEMEENLGTISSVWASILRSWWRTLSVWSRRNMAPSRPTCGLPTAPTGTPWRRPPGMLPVRISS